MINVSDAVKTIYKSDSIPKVLTIDFPDIDLTFTNSDLISEAFELTESIETERNLTFTGCISSQVVFKVANIARDLRGQYVEITLQAEQTDPLYLFRGYVESQQSETREDVITEITAYDILYQKGNVDCGAWYQTLTFPMTIKQFRDAFFTFIGITQETVTLVNDNLSMKKMVSADTQINARYIMQCICQANGRYGQIGRDGLFHYRKLDTTGATFGTYPGPNTFPGATTFPSKAKGIEFLIPKICKDVSADPYRTAFIDKVAVWDEGGVVQGDYGSGTNVFRVTNNVVAYSVDLFDCAEGIYNEVSSVALTPITVKLIGLPYMECGDGFICSTKKNTPTSYILDRHLTGIHSLTDEYTSSLDQFQGEYENLSAQIQRLNGKSNHLSRTIDETRSELSDYERQTDGTLTEMGSTITQTVDAITAEVTRATQAESNLNTTISETAQSIIEQTTESISTEVNKEKTRAQSAESGLSTTITETAETLDSKITQTATSITTEVNQTISEEVTRAKKAESDLGTSITSTATTLDSKIDQTAESITSTVTAETTRAKKAEKDEADRAKSVESSLSSSITQTADAISSEVTRAKNAESTLSSSITQTAEAVSSKVSKGDVCSEINQSSDTITLSSNRLVINSTNFTLDNTGKMTAKSAAFKGDIQSGSTITCGDNFKVDKYGNVTAADMKSRDLSVEIFLDIVADWNDGSTTGVTIDYSQMIKKSKNQTFNLGNSYKPMHWIWLDAEPIIVSDRNKKKNIHKLKDVYFKLFKLLKPVMFNYRKRYKSGDNEDKVYHTGFIAQDVEDAMAQCGLDESDFGGFVKCENEDKHSKHKYNYHLVYGEFIALNVAVTQQLQQKVETLENKVSDLEARLAKLEALVSQNEDK